MPIFEGCTSWIQVWTAAVALLDNTSRQGFFIYGYLSAPTKSVTAKNFRASIIQEMNTKEEENYKRLFIQHSYFLFCNVMKEQSIKIYFQSSF